MTPSDPRSRRPVARWACAVLTAALAAGTATGCGIRTTSVPVDAGPAPSRVACAPPVPAEPPGAADSAVVQLYLVCGGQVAPIKRTMTVRPQVRPEDRLTTARSLLFQLQRNPGPQESGGGFSTGVPGNLEVTGPLPGDPREALRLSQPLDELPSFALAQIVCTFADTAVSTGGRAVVLGGESADVPAKRYLCTSELRTNPATAESAGTAVR